MLAPEREQEADHDFTNRAEGLGDNGIHRRLVVKGRLADQHAEQSGARSTPTEIESAQGDRQE